MTALRCATGEFAKVPVEPLRSEADAFRKGWRRRSPPSQPKEQREIAIDLGDLRLSDRLDRVAGIVRAEPQLQQLGDLLQG